MHFNFSGRTQEFDVKRRATDIIPSLDVARVLLNQAAHLNLEKIRAVVVFNFEGSKFLFLDCGVSNEELMRGPLGFMLVVNPRSRELRTN